MKKKQVIVSESPVLFEHYYVEDSIVVVIDAIRMSATIITALANGANEVMPVAKLEETLEFKKHSYLVAGERDAKKVEGFDFGNSPFEFTKEKLANRKLAISTTNGTQVINRIKEKTDGKSRVLLGSFLNISRLAAYLISQNKNIIIQCSGWKNTISIEDILFAGQLSNILLAETNFYGWRDSTFMAQQQYLLAKDDLIEYVYKASARLNSKRDWLGKDIEYCFQEDKFELIPELLGNKIVCLR